MVVVLVEGDLPDWGQLELLEVLVLQAEGVIDRHWPIHLFVLHLCILFIFFILYK